MQPRAIETRYKGYRFRSRLEARWAVFFDALGLKWEYEPEGFELPGGVRYLPDFRVTSKERGIVWFEVKPATGGDSSKALAFATAGAGKIAVLSGPPELTSYPCYVLDRGEPDSVCELTGETIPGYPSSVIEDYLVFVDAYVKYAPWYFAWGTFGAGELPDWFDGRETVEVLRAINAARSARFEHGESGAR